MKKMRCIPALLLCAALMLTALSGCSPSPTAVTVGDRRVDASEYVFYLNYNRVYTNSEDGTVVFDAEALADAREAALEQIVTNEVVRLKCDEYGIKLSASDKDALKLAKKDLIEDLGGKAAYLEYLNQSLLTDRAYDKFRENEIYYNLLSAHVAQDSENYFTDEMLRQYFAENYATVKYICISLVDDAGEYLDRVTRAEKLELAASVAELAAQPGADFDALMEEYNEDPAMTMGYPLSRLEAESTYYLKTLFQLEENGVSGIIKEDDGLYILKRCPVSATFYDENQAEIAQMAMEDRFDLMLSEWKDEYTVTTGKILDKINLSNLREYLK